MKGKLLFSISFFLFLLMLTSPILKAEFDVDELRKNLPKLLGANNHGREFYITFHPCWEELGESNDLRIYVSSGVATNVTMEIEGKSIKETKRTIPNDIIEFRLNPAQGQCYQKTDRELPQPEQVFRGYGIYIYSDDPIICYGVTRYHYTSDGFLALPVHALGKEYIVASYADPSSNEIQWLTSYSSVVAPYDNTKVRFTLGGTEWTVTPGGMKPGDYRDYTLNRGDVLLVAGLGAFADLSGSRVIASKPVSVISGSFCAYIPSDKGYCDFIIEMDLPTNTWGRDYFVTRMKNRRKNSIIKIFAKEPDTKIYRDGRQIAIIPNVGGVYGVGFLEMRSDDGPPRSVVISGDKPISITQYNPGQEDDDVISDPFQLVLTPLEQFQKEIIFNTPGIRGGFGFPENYVNIVYEADNNGGMPDDLQLGTVLGSEVVWKNINGFDATPGDPFAYLVHGRQYNSKMIQLDGDGVYRIRAEKPFCAYAYGFSNYDSYGFPTSVALGDLTKPDTVCPYPTWTMDCYGAIDDGLVVDLPNDEEVRSNLSIIYHHKEASYNFEFSYTNFMPGESKETKWKANVVDPSKDARLVVTFSDRRGNDTMMIINFYAPKFTIRPEYVDYGLLDIGEYRDETFWVINESSTSDVYIEELKLKSGTEGFEIIGFNLPTIIFPRDSIPFTVRFTATQTSITRFRDSIGVGDTCIFSYKSLVEARVGEPTIEVSDANFGDVSVGRTVNRDIYIKNAGSTELIITGYEGPAENVYTHDLPYISEAEPLIIPAGVTKNYVVSFTPKEERYYPDQILFYNNAKRIDSISILNGRGIKSYLISNSYDWGRKRISRENFPVEPYKADYEVIHLENNGTEEVKIIDIQIVSEIRGSAFKFDRELFKNMTIPADGTAAVPVTFLPNEPGEYELVIRYDNTAGSETETTLKGVGILPRIATSDYDFGTTIVDDFDSPNERTITFTNEAWEYGDSLTIFDFVTLPNAGAISSAWADFGSEGFKYNKLALEFPIVLQEGESVQFPAQFVAAHVGNNSASLRSSSDAEADVTSNWNGDGYSQSLTAAGGYARTCLNDIEYINCEIVNTGSGDLVVTELEISQLENNFTFRNPSDALGFTLPEGESRTIVVKYQPISIGNHTADLIVRNTSLEMPEILAIPGLTGLGEQFTRNTSVFISAESKNPIIGQKVRASIRLDNGEDISLAQIQELEVKVNFDHGFLKVDRGEIKLGALIENGFNIENLSVNDAIGEITFFIVAKGPTNFIDGYGDLFHLTFNTFLPTQSDTSGFATIRNEITALGSSCVILTNTSNNLELKPVCINDLRKIVHTGGTYSFAPINPNPVTSSNANLEFSVALESWTEISIINAKGEVVAKPLAEVLKPGEYAVNLNLSGLVSGTYYCKLVSGPYTETRSLLIIK